MSLQYTGPLNYDHIISNNENAGEWWNERASINEIYSYSVKEVSQAETFK